MDTSTSSLPVCRFQHTRIRPEPLLDNKDNGTPTPRKAPLSDCGTLHFGLHVTLVIDSSVVQRLAETVCVAPNQQVIDLRVQRKVRSYKIQNRHEMASLEKDSKSLSNSVVSASNSSSSSMRLISRGVTNHPYP